MESCLRSGDLLLLILHPQARDHSPPSCALSEGLPAEPLWLLWRVRHDRLLLGTVTHPVRDELFTNYKHTAISSQARRREGTPFYPNHPSWKWHSLIASIPSHEIPSQTTAQDESMPGPLGTTSLGDGRIPIFCLSLMNRPGQGLGSVILLLSGTEKVIKWHHCSSLLFLAVKPMVLTCIRNQIRLHNFSLLSFVGLRL